MIGRTPESISIIRPMRNGVIADYDTTATMLSHFLKAARKKRSAFSSKPNVVICVPTGITKVEERAVVDAAKQAGAKEAFTIAEPFAAAIGSDLPVWEPTGSMIVDIGGGTTEVAVISLGGIVTSKSIRTAGNDLDSSITQYIRKEYNLMIGERTAEDIKQEIGSAKQVDDIEDMEIRGRDLLTGLPKTMTITSSEITTALKDEVEKIVDAIKVTLEKTTPELSADIMDRGIVLSIGVSQVKKLLDALNVTLEKSPPELAADIMDRGIVLSGGGALLKNLSAVISDETEIPVFVAENPLDCVAIGTGKSLENIQHFRANSNVSSQRSID